MNSLDIDNFSFFRPKCIEKSLKLILPKDVSSFIKKVGSKEYDPSSENYRNDHAALFTALCHFRKASDAKTDAGIFKIGVCILTLPIMFLSKVLSTISVSHANYIDNQIVFGLVLFSVIGFTKMAMGYERSSFEATEKGIQIIQKRIAKKEENKAASTAGPQPK